MRYRNKYLVMAFFCAAAFDSRAELAVFTAQRNDAPAQYTADGVVEAVRDSLLAAQTPGRVTELNVKVGDTVRAGQQLARIDERIAAEQMAASRAQLEAAKNEYERQRQLFEKQYISRAAMDRAEAQYKAVRAQANSSTTQTQLHTITAPYAGIIASVPAEVGDMAMPGTPLLAIYDPHRLRVVVSVPETVAEKLKGDVMPVVEIPAASQKIDASAMEILPTRDTRAHTAQIRLAIAADLSGVRPGQFARAYLTLRGATSGTLLIPQTAVIHRAEFDAVYIIGKDGNPQLRQVHLGRVDGANVEVLAGLDAGERIALDALAAARVR